MAKIEYRHPTMDDIEIMTRIINEAGRDLPMHRDLSADEVRRWTFGEPDYNPEGYLLAFIGDEPVALGGSFIQKSRQESGMNDGYVELDIMPNHLGKGIEQHLMGFGIEYLRSNGIKFAKQGIRDTKGWRHDLALEFGMKDVRHGYTMLYDKELAPVEFPVSDGYDMQHIMFSEATDSELEDFVSVFNDSFQDHWNFSPVPVQRFIKFRDEEKEDILRFTFARKGDDIAGLCFYAISIKYNKQNNSLAGWVNTLGVRKKFRRDGLGRALLSNCMKWLWDQGMRQLYLGMEAENKKALDLYTSLGYRIEREGINYELVLEK